MEQSRQEDQGQEIQPSDGERLSAPQLESMGGVSARAAGVELDNRDNSSERAHEDISALAREARLRLKPPAGLEIHIKEDEVALETIRQVDAFKSVISGSAKPEEVLLHEGQETKGPLDIFDQLSDLSALYVEDKDFETLITTLITQGLGEAEAQSQVSELIQAHKTKVAKIIKHSVRADDFFFHTGKIVNLALDGHAKSRGRLMKDGEYFAGSGSFISEKRQNPQSIIKEMTEQSGRGGFGDATHSLLFHARQRDGIKDITPSLYLPVGPVIERTPILISGQDQKNLKGVRIRGNDEAHGQDKTRYEFSGVQIHVDDEYIAGLPEVEDRKMIHDVAFMPADPTAETAYDYSYEIADGVILVEEDDEILIGRVIDMLPAESYIRQVESIARNLEPKRLFNITRRLVLLSEKIEAGGLQEFKSKESERAWMALVEEHKKVKEVFEEQFKDSESWERKLIERGLAETAIIRVLMRESSDIEPGTPEALFMLPGPSEESVNDKIRKALTDYLRGKMDSSEAGHYVEYKQVQLGFSQEDMAKSVVAEYAAHHN